MLRHFDIIASLYDRLVGAPDVRRLRALLRLQGGGLLLDAGGGTGRVSAYFSSLVDHVVVCDLSIHMLRQAEKKRELFPVRAHTERLPFRDGAFERILVVDALHHFCDRQRALTELLRVLKKGGRMVIEEPDFDRPVTKVIAALEKLAFMGSRFLSASTLSAMVVGEGYCARVAHKDSFRLWFTIDKQTDEKF